MSDPSWVNAGRGDSVGTATIATDGTFTIVAHGLNDGQPVEVDTLTGGAAAVLREDTTYFVVNSATDTFDLVSALGDEIITFGSASGADVYTRVPYYSAIELRRVDSTLLYAGHADEFGARQGVRPHSTAPVTLAGTTWTVENLTAVVYPGLTSLSGPYRVQHPSESGSLDPADGTNDRIDALDLQIQDDDEDASGFRRARVVYVAGTPAGSPDAPAVTANSLRLATILVGSGGTPAPAISTLAQYTVASGGVLPVRDNTEGPDAGRYHGMVRYRRDDDVMEVWDGSAWAPIGGPGASPPAVQNFDSVSLFTFTNTSFGIGTSGGTFQNCAVVFTAPVSGRVLILWNTVLDKPSEVANVAYMSPAVRTGNVIGSGTVVLAAADNNSRRASRSEIGVDEGGARNRSGCSYLLSGLTAGNEYNCRLEHRVTSTNAEAFHRALQIIPMP
jgi:hypothetical protein